MDDTQKMLQSIINGQSALREDLLRAEQSLKKEFYVIRQEMHDDFKKVNKRLDTIGSHLAYVDDDTPSREEFDGLEKRVSVVEDKVAT